MTYRPFGIILCAKALRIREQGARTSSHGEIWLEVFSRIINTIYIHSEQLHFTFFHLKS